ncbi:AbiTii domain-containing protein [Paraburkholderia sacchari]|uniref:AbiTii domain-containing protein n=1 Tax=Paraburkholderia sacchari TaxID=159450 RepID=UPI0039A5BADF
MKSLVFELQAKVLDSSSTVSDLLRTALIVARKLEVGEFEAWVTLELNGYADHDDDVPEYRKLEAALKVWNPYHGWQPLFTADAKMHERLARSDMGQSIAELETLLSGKSHSFYSNFGPELERMLMQSMEVAMRPAREVSRVQIAGIVERVRNLILDWALRLERAGVLGENMTFSSEEKAKASEATVTYNVENQTVIHGMSNSQVQQGASQSSQTFVQQQAVDATAIASFITELRKQLDTLGLSEDARQEIEADIATVEVQGRSPKPRVLIIKEALKSIRSILENAAGGALAGAVPSLLAELARHTN